MASDPPKSIRLTQEIPAMDEATRQRHREAVEEIEKRAAITKIIRVSRAGYPDEASGDFSEFTNYLLSQPREALLELVKSLEERLEKRSILINGLDTILAGDRENPQQDWAQSIQHFQAIKETLDKDTFELFFDRIKNNKLEPIETLDEIIEEIGLFYKEKHAKENGKKIREALQNLRESPIELTQRERQELEDLLLKAYNDPEAEGESQLLLQQLQIYQRYGEEGMDNTPTPTPTPDETTPLTSLGEVIENFLTRYQPLEASPDETAPQDIIITPDDPPMKRRSQILEAFSAYTRIEKYTGNGNWLRETANFFDKTTGSTTGEFSRRLLGGCRYLLVLEIENPLHTLHLDKDEIQKLTPQEKQNYLQASAPSFGYTKSSIDSKVDLPLQVDPLLRDLRPVLNAYTRYTVFDPRTGEHRAEFKKLVIDKITKIIDTAQIDVHFWSREASTYNVDRQYSLDFLENGWEEFDSLDTTQINLTHNEFPYISFLRIPLSRGLTKVFVRFERTLPTGEGDPTYGLIENTDINGTIEHFCIRKTLDSSSLISADGIIHPKYKQELIPFLENEDRPLPLQEYEIPLLEGGWSEIDRAILDTWMTPGQAFPKSHKSKYLEVLATQEEGQGERIFVRFSNTPIAPDINKKLTGVKTDFIVYPLTQEYRDGKDIYATIPDYTKPESELLLDLSKDLLLQGYIRCPNELYAEWTEAPTNRAKQEKICEVFKDSITPKGLPIITLTVTNPYQPEKPWVFIKINSDSRPPQVFQHQKVTEYTTQYSFLTKENGFVAGEIQPHKKRTPEEIEGERLRFEKLVRAFNRNFEKLRTLTTDLNQLRRSSGIPQEMEHIFNKIFAFNEEANKKSSENKPISEIQPIIEQMQTITNEGVTKILALIEEEKQKETKIIHREPEKPRKKMKVNPWVLVAGFVLGAFIGLANKFLPEENTQNDNKNTAESSKSAGTEIPSLELKFDALTQPGDAIVYLANDVGVNESQGKPSLQDAVATDSTISDAEQIAALQRDLGIAPKDGGVTDYAGDYTWQFYNDAAKAEANKLADASANVPDLPIDAFQVPDMPDMAIADAAKIAELKKDVGVELPKVLASAAVISHEDKEAPQKPDHTETRQESTTKSIPVKSGDTTIGIMVKAIMEDPTIQKEHPGLKRADVRRTIAIFSLKDAAHSSIKAGNLLQFRYSFPKEGPLVIESIKHIKATAVPNEAPTPIPVAETTEQKTTPVAVDGPPVQKPSSFQAGDSILYRTSAGEYGTYKIGQTLSNGLIKLEGKIGSAKSTLIVKPESIETRAQILDLDENYGSFGVKKIADNADKLQFTGFDGGIQDMILNYFLKHKQGFDRGAALLATKKIMASAKNIKDTSTDKIYKRPPDLMEVGDWIILTVTKDDTGKDQYVLTQIFKKHPNATELPKTQE